MERRPETLRLDPRGAEIGNNGMFLTRALPWAEESVQKEGELIVGRTQACLLSC